MAITTTLIILAIIIIIGLISFKITKAITKAIFFTITILGIAGLVFVFFIYQDASDFRENFPTQPSLLLLESEDEIIAGMQGKFSEGSEPELISSQQLQDIQENYMEDDLDAILGENYKLFIFELDAFDTDNISMEGTMISSDQAMPLLMSDSPIDDYIGLVLEDREQIYKDQFREQLQQTVEGDAEFKALIFASMFSGQMEESGSLFILEQYSKGNILIYPETILFRIMKRMPASILSKIMLAKEV